MCLCVVLHISLFIGEKVTIFRPSDSICFEKEMVAVSMLWPAGARPKYLNLSRHERGHDGQTRAEIRSESRVAESRAGTRSIVERKGIHEKARALD